MQLILQICAVLALAAGGPQSELQRELGQLLENLPHQRVTVSACVVRLPEQRRIYALHEDEALIPASCQKVLTAAVALDVLGPDHGFETRLARRGDDVLLIGGGDPGLGDPRLAADRNEKPLAVFERWANLLVAPELATFPGALVVDDSAFETLRVHPSWEPEDLPKWFGAPVGGLNFNDNCIEVTLHPTQPGVQVRHAVFPPNAWVRFENRCKTGAGTPWIHRNADSNLYQLRGRCSKRYPLQSVSVTDPGLFTGEVFRAVLKARGIDFAGGVRRATAAERALDSEILAAHRTPLAGVLGRALRNSQNLFAECLIKAAAREDGQRRGQPQPGSWSAGAALVQRRLSRWDVPLGGLVFADGSGLSRENRLSAAQLTAILAHVYLDMPRAGGDLFIASLAQPGRDGTLHKRMKELPGKLYGKTGYMSGVRSLCGFVVPQGEAHWYAFAVVFNDIPGGTRPYTQIQNQFCHVLARRGG